MHRVTILIACYNDEDYIDNAIESAFNQDYQGPMTICVIDDGSTDKSLEIAKSYFSKPLSDSYRDNQVWFQEDRGRFGNTKYVVMTKPNGGPSDARNWGIGYAWPHTDIYAVLDADDQMYENKISVCEKVMSEDMETVGVVYADYDTHHIDTEKTIREFKEPYSRKRLIEECVVHSGSLINKKALDNTHEDTGYYDFTMRTREDYDLWMRISEKFMLVHVPQSLTLVRVTGDNSSFVVNQEVWQRNWSRVMEKMQDRLQ